MKSINLGIVLASLLVCFSASPVAAKERAANDLWKVDATALVSIVASEKAPTIVDIKPVNNPAPLTSSLTKEDKEIKQLQELIKKLTLRLVELRSKAITK